MAAPRLGFEIFQFQQSYLEVVSKMEADFIWPQRKAKLDTFWSKAMAYVSNSVEICYVYEN